MALKLFVDRMSQPCRAILILLEANKIPYEECIIKIAKGISYSLQCSYLRVHASMRMILPGEHLSEDFKKVNPNGQIPAINDNGFLLFERCIHACSWPCVCHHVPCVCACSGTIMRYLVQKYQLPDHWYPRDSQRRAKIDEYLDWHHTNLRIGAARLLFHQVIIASYPAGYQECAVI